MPASVRWVILSVSTLRVAGFTAGIALVSFALPEITLILTAFCGQRSRCGICRQNKRKEDYQPFFKDWPFLAMRGEWCSSLGRKVLQRSRMP